jgi:hypothetical protein
MRAQCTRIEPMPESDQCQNWNSARIEPGRLAFDGFTRLTPDVPSYFPSIIQTTEADQISKNRGIPDQLRNKKPQWSRRGFWTRAKPILRLEFWRIRCLLAHTNHRCCTYQLMRNSRVEELSVISTQLLGCPSTFNTHAHKPLSLSVGIVEADATSTMIWQGFLARLASSQSD